MPHISLEYTENIQKKLKSDFFDQILTVIIQAAGVKAENCKSRAIKIKNFHIGTKNKNQGFVHLKIKILEGRTQNIKNQIANNSLKVLKSYFYNTNESNIQYSIEIQEMKLENYFTSNAIIKDINRDM